jgi:VanZ family protein
LKEDSAGTARAFGAIDVVLWIIVCVWAAFIFFMSAHTGSDFQNGTDIVARVKRALDVWQTSVFGGSVDVISSCAHFVEYTVFGALLFAALSRRLPKRRRKVALVLAIVIASLYGVSDEFHQLFVPGRACDPLDWLVDTAGAMLGASVACAVKNKIAQRKQS